MIHIQSLNKQNLHEYINSEEYDKLRHTPISRHRALSHFNNPRADDEDILLLLAYEDTDLVGYLGVLPDLIYYNNRFEKCGWLSCLWIDPDHRGKQVALKLVQKSFEVWDDSILITEFTGPAKGLYDKTKKFRDLKEKQGLRLYVRSDLQKILPPKKEIFKKMKPLLRAFDFVFNIVFDLRFYFYRNRLLDRKLEYIEHIDDEVSDFIKNRQENQLFKRRADELNWIIKNPWILSSPTQNSESIKYYFSSLDKRFEFVSIKIRNPQNEIVAFLIFARRNDDLKLPYFYANDLETITTVINYHLLKWRIKTFTTYDEALSQVIRNSKTPALFKKKIKRGYIISTKFNSEAFGSEFLIQDGDADCSFT